MWNYKWLFNLVACQCIIKMIQWRRTDMQIKYQNRYAIFEPMKKRILYVHGSYMAHNTIIIKTHLNMVLEDRWFATYGSIHLTRSLTGHKSFRHLSPEIFTVNKLRNTYRWYWISSSANNISVQKYTYVQTWTLVYKISTLNVIKEAFR